MTDKPKSTGHPMCKVCGSAHPMGGPHAWDKPEATKPTVSRQRLAEIAAIPDKAIDTSDIPEATPAQMAKGKLKKPRETAAPKKRGRGRPKQGEGFDKTAYQRELMRKRRAAKKGK